jgi:hypothetical protein
MDELLDPQFPFSKREWQQLSKATSAVCNAILVDDEVLRKSCFVTLQSVLGELRQVHGEHPILLETEADFCDDFAIQRVLYQQAIDLAVARGWPTYTARISFAQSCLDHNERARANAQLLACKKEVATLGDAAEQAKWLELLALSTNRQ